MNSWKKNYVRKNWIIWFNWWRRKLTFIYGICLFPSTFSRYTAVITYFMPCSMFGTYEIKVGSNSLFFFLSARIYWIVLMSSVVTGPILHHQLQTFGMFIISLFFMINFILFMLLLYACQMLPYFAHVQ